MTEQAYDRVWSKVDTYKNETEFMSDLGDLAQSEIPDITVKEFGLIYSRAWSDGHSAGYHDVLIVFNELLHLVKELYSVHDALR